MKFKPIRSIVSRILVLESFIMILPLILSFIYKEPFINQLAYLITAIICGLLGGLATINTTKDIDISSKEGLMAVGLSWVIFSVFGALPYVITATIPNYFEALFEACSGFSTTGATVINDFEVVSKSIFFYRSLTQFIGGMGVLVFILTLMNSKKEQTSIHLLKAESTGPDVGKLTGKTKNTARILYLLYTGLTVLETLLLCFDKDIDLFTALCISMSTTSTGGFAVLSSSIGSYSIFSQYVVIVAMLLSGINFSLFYLLLIRKFKQIFENEELRTYLLIIIFSLVIIFIDTNKLYSTGEETFRNALFNIVSIMTTTGFVIGDFTAIYPVLSQLVLIILMFIGGCAGSTAGGFKVSRLLIVAKDSYNSFSSKNIPDKTDVVRVDNKVVNNKIVKETKNHLFLYLLILVFCTFIVATDPNSQDILTSFTSSLSCISNVGPTMGTVIGSGGNFALYNDFTTFILSIEMLIGRLELFPILIMFSKKTYEKF